MEPSAENQKAVLIAIIVFIAINGVMAIIGTIRTRKLAHSTSEDALTTHYLGGRSFGPVVLFGTMFASLFSGGTVVGIPQEAYYTGWQTMRIINYSAFFVFLFAGVAPRLRKASMVRNHQTPVDFITDMYQCQLLRYSIATCQIMSQFIWMATNVVAIRNDFNSALGMEPGYPWITVGIMAFILISEWFGGMNAVALTDCVQGFVMVFGALSVVSVIKYHWGGITALDPTTFPRRDFYQTPSQKQQWDWWQQGFLQAGSVFRPVYIQRVYAAASVKGVKMGTWASFMGPWVAQFGFIFMGVMGVSILGESCQTSEDPEVCMSPDSPFAAILEELMNLGGFSRVVAIILQCSALAAIMSTTDSIIISISQIITAEVVYPMKPNASPNLINWFGRGVSLTVAALALIVGLKWEGSINILFQLNEPFQMQVLPAFMIGLYSPTLFHPWSLAFGALIGMIATLVIEVTKTNNEDFADFALRPGLSTFAINCVCVVLFESFRLLRNRLLKGRGSTSSFQRESESLGGSDNINQEEEEDANDSFVDNTKNSPIQENSVVDNQLSSYEAIGQDGPFPDRPAWDKPNLKRFGTHSLTPTLLNIMMSSSTELIKNVYFLGFIVLGITITTPLTPEFQPPLEDNMWLVLPAVIRGYPWWAFKAIILLVVSYLITVPMILSMPTNFTLDEEKMLRSGINADVVELEPEEKGGRTQYDQNNPALSARRSMIRQQTARILEVNLLAEERAKEIKVNDVGVQEAQAELVKLVSRRDFMEPREFSKMLSDLPEEEDDGIESTNYSGAVENKQV